MSESPLIVEHDIVDDDVNVGCFPDNWVVKLELISKYCKLGKLVSELPFIVEHDITDDDVNVGCLLANSVVKLDGDEPWTSTPFPTFLGHFLRPEAVSAQMFEKWAYT